MVISGHTATSDWAVRREATPIIAASGGEAEKESLALRTVIIPSALLQLFLMSLQNLHNHPLPSAAAPPDTHRAAIVVSASG